ncbi:MAG: ImmA/IrrE family metallo-endopeptidase [Salinarimonas sp.]
MRRFLTREAIEERALALRKALGLGEVLPIDAMTVLTTLNRHYGVRYRREPDELMGGDEARYDADNKVIIIAESTFRRMNARCSRAIFTLAHEVGHFILGHESVRSRRAERRNYEKDVDHIRHQEREADVFAAAFIAPMPLLQKLDSEDPLTPEKIELRTGLSRSSSEFRFEELQETKRRENGGKRPLPSSVIDFLTEAKRRGFDIKTDLT